MFITLSWLFKSRALRAQGIYARSRAILRHIERDCKIRTDIDIRFVATEVAYLWYRDEIKATRVGINTIHCKITNAAGMHATTSPGQRARISRVGVIEFVAMRCDSLVSPLYISRHYIPIAIDVWRRPRSRDITRLVFLIRRLIGCRARDPIKNIRRAELCRTCRKLGQSPDWHRVSDFV